MEIFVNFISEYGTTILYAILTALAGYIGIAVKNLYQKYINTKTKREVARTVVQAIEQLYKNLRGEEKLNKALSAMGIFLILATFSATSSAADAAGQVPRVPLAGARTS